MRTPRTAVLAPALLLTALTVPLASAAAAGSPAKQAVAVGSGGAVATETVGASRAALNVLRAGGNAVDAAVAAAATLGVDDPFVAGPGGGGFMVIYLAKQKKIVTIDGREMCPRACTPKLFVDKGKPLDFELARHSGISIGVPGLVAQWAKATALYGRRTFAQNLAPAIALARHGFPVSQNFHNTTAISLADLQAFSSSRKLFLTKAGQPLPVGTTFRNPDLARTYELLAANGPSYLYGGPLGRAIAQTAQHPPVAKQAPAGFKVIPGIMTADDVREYDAKSRPPTHVRYRKLDVYSMAPPSSGGTTIGEALNILSGYPMGAEPRAEALFHYLEASRLAFADRGAYVGDSDYVPVPIAGLLNKKFAATRRCLIHDHALTSPVAPGDPFAPYSGSCGTSSTAPVTGREGTSTNHLVTADKWGNLVSYTNTIEQLAGSGMTVPGYGFLLNNEMTDFDFAPAVAGAYDPNLAAPGKRPRSSMSPTIVLRDGAPWLVVGSPGGSTIITTVLQTLINRIDFNMSLPAAIAAPRASQANYGPSLVETAFAHSAYGRILQKRYGETFSVAQPPEAVIGFVNALEILRPGLIQAATEPTRLGGGSVLVVHPR